MGGAEQGRGGVEDDPDGHAAHQGLQAPLGEEGRKKIGAPEQFQVFRNDAPPQIDPPQRQVLEGQVAGLAPIEAEEEGHGLDAEPAGPGDGLCRDGRHRVLTLSLGLASRPPEGTGIAATGASARLVAEKVVDIEDAGAGYQPLPAHMAMPPSQPDQQGLLPVGGGGEVRVPPLRGEGMVALTIPVEPRLAEAGPRGDDAGIAAGPLLPGVEGFEVLRSQEGDTPGDGLQIIEQADALPAELAGEVAPVDDPGQIGDVAAAILNRPGHGEGRAPGTGPRLPQIMRHQLREGVIGAAGQAQFPRQSPPALHLRRQGQDRLGPPDITDQYAHGLNPPPDWLA